ncbi:piwi-like protein Siwi [Ceratina calcarata]|uniref:Piwi-like protein Siwi n=1 Tax=Ceratina calcarata TaxID=156304 RepID=A0AAJ7J4T3_9HYME|nr:piwi-like protein Siwi [Ceratina calcarata]
MSGYENPNSRGRNYGRGRPRGFDDRRGYDDRRRGYDDRRGHQSSQHGSESRDFDNGNRRPAYSSQSSGPSPYARPSSTQGYQPKVKVVDRLGPRDDGASTSRQGASDSGDAGRSAVCRGRGSVRGRRVINLPEVETKPGTLDSKKGTTGQKVVMQSNYFKLLSTPSWCLFQYRVDFEPAEERTVVRKGLVRLHKASLTSYVFDGTVLYTTTRLPASLELISKRQSDNETIKISIRLVGELRKGDPHYIQVFNIIMRKCLELLKLQVIGRDYFDARAKIEIRQYRMELWPGYLTSIRQHENNLLMCAEIVHKVLRQQTLLDVLNDCYNQNFQDYKALFEQEVLGLVVLTDYNNNTYRICDVDYDTNPSSTFRLKNGEEIMYKDYYESKYQIKLRNQLQPLLVTKVKPKNRNSEEEQFVYLVPELCRATGMTDKMRENFQLMRAMAETTRVSPQARIDKLINFNRRLRGEPEVIKQFSEWNLKLDDKLVEVPARILPPERIVLNGATASSGQFCDWTRELQSKPAFCAARLQQWVVICLDRMRRDVDRFVGMLQECARGMNCMVDRPRVWEIQDDRANTYLTTIESVMSSANPELIFCVVTNNRADRYGAIKKKCTVDRPVPSQVFLAKNINSRNSRSIATKVAIQMNCKLGGAPWSVQLPDNIRLMVVGFDVCHDPQDRSRDYGALIATLNPSLTRYFSAVAHHANGEELSNQFSTNLERALHNYRQLNKALPSHIVIYRDGVGEGQVPYVFEHEVKAVKQKLDQIYETVPVKMAFIIVTKRINTRIFYNRNNPPPGTVVDDVVTNPLRYDFFIIPQSVRQGTVSPTAFNVIADTTGWTPDQIQRMTYKMCHMYYNWSGTVKVPATCQYAHKLAFLVAQFIHRPPDTRLENLLYFL